MTNLRKRLDNVLAELAVVREVLDESTQYPFCCLTFHKNGKISCEVKGPLPKDQFLRECMKCRARIRNFLECFASKIT